MLVAEVVLFVVQEEVHQGYLVVMMVPGLGVLEVLMYLHQEGACSAKGNVVLFVKDFLVLGNFVLEIVHVVVLVLGVLDEDMTFLVLYLQRYEV